MVIEIVGLNIDSIGKSELYPEIFKTDSNFFKIQVVSFKMIRRPLNLKGNPQHFIAIPLQTSDHICQYAFKVGLVYQLPAVVSYYPHAENERLNKPHFNVSCKELPILIQ